MSRIGKYPVQVIGGVLVTIDKQRITVKGDKGELSREIPGEVKVEMNDGVITCSAESNDRKIKALWGLSRVLINNMIVGVSAGYSKALEIVGVGYRVELKDNQLSLSVGCSHPIIVTPPPGIVFRIDGPTRVVVEGIDKELVGSVAARIRDRRMPEPYKGKGIRYAGEQIRRKAGKTAGK